MIRGTLIPIAFHWQIKLKLLWVKMEWIRNMTNKYPSLLSWYLSMELSVFLTWGQHFSTLHFYVLSKRLLLMSFFSSFITDRAIPFIIFLYFSYNSLITLWEVMILLIPTIYFMFWICFKLFSCLLRTKWCLKQPIKTKTEL